MRKRDIPNHRAWLFAALSFLSVTAIYMLFPWRQAHPQMWGDLVAALGLGDGVAAGHGWWRYGVRGLVGLGCGDLTQVLHMAGALSGGFCAGVIHLVLQALYPLAFKAYRREAVRMGKIFNVLILALVWLLALSEGYWNLFRLFTVHTLYVVLAMAGALALLRFVATGGIRWLFACDFATGLLAGCTPLGWGVLAAKLAVLAAVKRRRADSVKSARDWVDGSGGRVSKGEFADEQLPMPLLNPLIGERVKTPGALVFMIGVAASVGMDLVLAVGGNWGAGGTVALELMVAYWKELGSYVGWMDAIKAIGIVALPCAFNLRYCRRATDLERFLPRWMSVAYLVTGLVAYSQLSGIGWLWFWTWGGGSPVAGQPVFLAVVASASMLTMAVSVLVFTVDACFRDFRWLVSRCFSHLEPLVKEAEAVLGRTITMGGRDLVFVKGVTFASLAFGLCLASVPEREQIPHQVVMEAIRAFIDETEREVHGYSTVVGDSELNDALRLALHRSGSAAKVVAEEEVEMTSGGGNDVAWITDLPASATADDWNFSGLAARRNVGAEEASLSSSKVLELAERFVALERSWLRVKTYDRYLGYVTDLVKWRLARVLTAQLSASGAKLPSSGKTRMEGLVDALCRYNRSLPAIVAKRYILHAPTKVELTATEGLEIAITRNDLAMMRRYADLMPDANAALTVYARGLIYLADGQNFLAAEMLRRSVTNFPDEPAVMNNLAVALFRCGRSTEARQWMQKAARKSSADSRTALDSLRDPTIATNAAEIGLLSSPMPPLH